MIQSNVTDIIMIKWYLFAAIWNYFRNFNCVFGVRHTSCCSLLLFCIFYESSSDNSKFSHHWNSKLFSVNQFFKYCVRLIRVLAERYFFREKLQYSKTGGISFLFDDLLMGWVFDYWDINIVGFKEALCLSIKNTFVNLTLPVPIPDEEKKLTFYFHTSLWFLKRFYEGFKAFIKPFEALQRSAKITI